jgi:hypothetical protein
MGHKLVTALLETASRLSAATSERQEAVMNLALLIEKHSAGADRDAVYKELLPSEVFDISLEEPEKLSIVNLLSAQLGREPVEGGIRKELLWALGKPDGASSVLALETTLGYLVEGQSQSPVELWQGIISVERLIQSMDSTMLTRFLPSFEQLRVRVLAIQDRDCRKAMDGLLLTIGCRAVS